MLRFVVALCLVGAAFGGPPVTKSRSEIEKFRDFLESTRTDKGVILGRSADPSQLEGTAVWENSGKYQGDILLDDEQVEAMVQQYAEGRNAYIWPNTLWPNRVVVYEFANHFNQAQRNHILHAMAVLEDRTCIRFRQRNPGEFNHVLITGWDNGCYASVGYWAARGEHTINLSWWCFNTVVIIHEWLHVIGFFHMQSTHDRDWYVRINWANIERGMEHNFDRHATNVVSNLGLPYEYDSCMHYGTHAFSINGRSTIDALRAHTGTMGQTDYVTGYDFWRVDRHYGCAVWRTQQDYQPYYAKQNFEDEEPLLKAQVEPVAEEQPAQVEDVQPIKILEPVLPVSEVKIAN